MDHFNYFVCIYALGKVLKKRGLKVIAVFFILLYLNTCTLFLSKQYEKTPFRLECPYWLKCLCYQP